MPLIGPNAQAVVAEGETLFVIPGDDFVNEFQRQVIAMLVGCFNQAVDFKPPSASSVTPMVSGLWRRMRLRNLLVETSDFCNTGLA